MAKRGPGSCDDEPVSKAPRREQSNVILWDLDETLIIFNSLLSGAFARASGVEAELATGMGLTLEEIIFKAIDSKLFYTELQVADIENICDLDQYDDGKETSRQKLQGDGFVPPTKDQISRAIKTATASNPVPWFSPSSGDTARRAARRYRTIRSTVTMERAAALPALLPEHEVTHLRRLMVDIDGLTAGWLSGARKGFAAAARQGFDNVIVTAGGLIPTLAKLLIFDLMGAVDITNVYSAAARGKRRCFERIIEEKINALGPMCTFVAVGDGEEEQAAAGVLGVPFHKVTPSFSSLEAFFAQQGLECGSSDDPPDLNGNT